MLLAPRVAAAAGVIASLGALMSVHVASATAAPTRHVDHLRGAHASTTTAQPATVSLLAAGGGSVVTTPSVFLSFWGPEWSSGFSTGGYTSAQAQNYLETFFQGAGGSAWANVATQYCQGVSAGSTTCPAGASFVGNPSGQYLGAWVDTTSVPSSPAESDIAAAAARAVAHFGYRSGALYFVMTPTGKSESGFGSSGGWCAWHGSTATGGRQVPYTYLPYLPDAGYACGVNSVNSNDAFGHGYFDGFSIIAGHEYMESLTDPFPNSGWVDANGEENGDKCQWTGLANVPLGGTQFAVQPTWSNAAGGCQLQASGSPAPSPTPVPTPAPTPVPGAFTSYFSWYDNVSPGMWNDNIHVVNPGSAEVTGSVSVGGRSVAFSIAAGSEGFYSFPPGTMGGPVVVNASAGVVASQRVQSYSSFNEVAARTAADAATDLWFPWYDKASPGMTSDNIHIVNPSTASSVTGTVTVGPGGGALASTSFTLGPGATTAVTFANGVIGGPVYVHASAAVLASQRVEYGYTFNETAGQASSAAASTLYFNWYDHVSPGMSNDNVHIVNPGSAAVSGTVRLGSTGASVPFSVGGYGATYVNFGAAIGGPVTVSASGPVLASQRVQYYSSFNESPGRPAAAAAATSYMPWYDLASPGMANDNVHLLNPSASSVSGVIKLGAASVPFSVAAYGEWYGNFGGTIGGPVVVQVTSGGPILASQRVQFDQSFNEAAAAS